jgi:hypothetical protein
LPTPPSIGMSHILLYSCMCLTSFA